MWMERMKRKTFDDSRNFSESEFDKFKTVQYASADTGVISSRRYRKVKKEFKGRISIIPETRICFIRCLPEMNAQNQHQEPITEDQRTLNSNDTNASAIEATSEARLNLEPNHKDYRNIKFNSDPYMENTFFFVDSRLIRSSISSFGNRGIGVTRTCHQEMKVSSFQHLPIPIDSSSVPSFDKGEQKIIYNELIQKVSEVNEVENTVSITISSASKFKISSLIRETPASRKSVFANDAVYDIIRQQRLSWSEHDKSLPNEKLQSLSISDSFGKRDQRDFYKGKNTELEKISYNYECRKKHRVRKLKNWQSKMILNGEKSSNLDLEERILRRQNKEKLITWRKHFSDESELDDSGSSLDGSFLHHCSDTSDSSDCESLTYSSSTAYCNRTAPPTSSRIFEDSIAECETEFLKTFRKQFWNSDMVKNDDKRFVDDFGFTEVIMQALKCLCLFNGNGDV